MVRLDPRIPVARRPAPGAVSVGRARARTADEPRNQGPASDPDPSQQPRSTSLSGSERVPPWGKARREAATQACIIGCSARRVAPCHRVNSACPCCGATSRMWASNERRSGIIMQTANSMYEYRLNAHTYGRSYRYRLVQDPGVYDADARCFLPRGGPRSNAALQSFKYT